MWESPTQTGDHSLARAGTPLRLRPTSLTWGTWERPPEILRLASWGWCQRGWGLSLPPLLPTVSMEKAVHHAWGFFVR